MSDNDKKTEKAKTPAVVIVITAILLAVILFVPFKDNGGQNRVRYFPISHLYSVTTYSDLSEPEINGVAYSYDHGYLKKTVTEVKVLSFTVHESAEVDGELPHTSEISDLIDYYHENAIEGTELNSIQVFDGDGSEYNEIGLYFRGDRSIEHADSAYLLMKEYLDEHPDSFVTEGYKIKIFYHGSEGEEDNKTQYTIVYLVNEELELTDILIPDHCNILPDEVPERCILEDSGTPTIHILGAGGNVGEVDDEQLAVIEGMYPDCTVVYEYDDMYDNEIPLI